jgi:MraZ protein
MLSGEFSVTLDETGRIVFPRKLRDILDTGRMKLTKGADACLWLFTPEQWGVFEKTIYSSTDQFSARGRRQRQHFIGGMQPVDIDSHGRILIPPPLRDHAGLSKECIVFGQVDYIEIWDRERYKSYLDASEADFKAGLEEIGAMMRNKRELGGYGDSPYSGFAGRDDRISRSEGKE